MPDPIRNQTWPKGREEFRLPRQSLTLGIGTLACFGLIGILGAFAAATDLDGSFRYPVLTASAVACICSFFSLLGAYLILAYARQRLVVRTSSVECIGCFQTRDVNLSEVVRAVWKPGGALVLHDAFGSVGIPLAPYVISDRTQIVRFFRGALAEGIQEGWEGFEWRYLPGGISWWQRRRLLGRAHFVWVEGVLLGLGIGACLLLREWIAGPLDWRLSLAVLATFGVGGHLVGAYRWKTNEAEIRPAECQNPF